MKDTWLVQRLKQPPKSAFQARASQVFGGGMLQLSPTAWKLLQVIFDIDYMGSAEYEFGSLPMSFQAFQRDAEKLKAFELVLKREEIKPNWKRESIARNERMKELHQAKKDGKRAKRAKPVVVPTEPVTVYVLCREEHAEEVSNRIRLLAREELRTKDGAHFSYALDPMNEYDSAICGWYELDNGFFFFTDKVMWEKATRLFKHGEYDDEVLEERSTS